MLRVAFAQKTDAAQVDAADGNVQLHRPGAGTKNGAVSAEGKDQFRLMTAKIRNIAAIQQFAFPYAAIARFFGEPYGRFRRRKGGFPFGCGCEAETFFYNALLLHTYYSMNNIQVSSIFIRFLYV